jgi:CheY-like chemotaxis protein
MNILIVEDDENKRNQIIEFIEEEIAASSVTIAKSFQSGLRAIVLGGFDLILLDMTMPTFDIGFDEDGGRPQAYAGREILRQMDRREITTPVIVVTQFDKFGAGADELRLEELDEQLHKEHPASYQGAVYYNAAYADWKQELAKIVSGLRTK